MKTSRLNHTLYEELAPIFRSAWVVKEASSSSSYSLLKDRVFQNKQIDKQLNQQDEQDILSIRSDLDW